MKRSFATITSLLIIVLFAALFAGCGRSWPFQWQASEPIKEAQALVEDNIKAARPHASTVGKVHIDEADAAARTVTEYVGHPKTRQPTNSPAARAAIELAKRDAARPAPTMRDVADALPEEIEESVMPWVDLGIDVLGIVGFPALALGLSRVRKKSRAVMDAFEQTVEAIDKAKLDDDGKAKLHTELAKSQDRATKKLVTKAKAKVA